MNTMEYWESQRTDLPYTLNGFSGTWNFSDHNLIPESLINFIMESFPKEEKFKRIPLEDINALMNDVWEGPGSMPKIMTLLRDMRAERLGKKSISVQTLSQDDVKTIDDYSDEEKVNFANNEE